MGIWAFLVMAFVICALICVFVLRPAHYTSRHLPHRSYPGGRPQSTYGTITPGLAIRPSTPYYASRPSRFSTNLPHRSSLSPPINYTPPRSPLTHYGPSSQNLPPRSSNAVPSPQPLLYPFPSVQSSAAGIGSVPPPPPLPQQNAVEDGSPLSVRGLLRLQSNILLFSGCEGVA